MQTRRRSALGCCSAETTRAMRNGASAFAGSSTDLDLEADHGERVGDRRRRVALVSRCSFSQESVNFIELFRALSWRLALARLTVIARVTPLDR